MQIHKDEKGHMGGFLQFRQNALCIMIHKEEDFMGKNNCNYMEMVNGMINLRTIQKRHNLFPFMLT